MTDGVTIAAALLVLGPLIGAASASSTAPSDRRPPASSQRTPGAMLDAIRPASASWTGSPSRAAARSTTGIQRAPAAANARAVATGPRS